MVNSVGRRYHGSGGPASYVLLLHMFCVVRISQVCVRDGRRKCSKHHARWKQEEQHRFCGCGLGSAVLLAGGDTEGQEQREVGANRQSPMTECVWMAGGSRHGKDAGGMGLFWSLDSWTERTQEEPKKEGRANKSR